MSIFRDFFVKEKPVFTGITRGVGGFGFGAAAGGGSSVADGSAANPFTSWTDLDAQGFTSTTKHLKLGGQTVNVTIDSGGYANFFISGDFYTILTHSNGYNSSAGSAAGSPTNVSTYTIGNIRGGSEGLDVDSSPGNDFLAFDWQDTDGTTVTDAFFTAMGPQLSTGYKPDSFYLGHTDSETSNAWRFKYSDGTSDSFDSQADHSSRNILAANLSSTLQNTWIRDNKILTEYRDAATSDPHAALLSFRHSALAVK